MSTEILASGHGVSTVKNMEKFSAAAS